MLRPGKVLRRSKKALRLAYEGRIYGPLAKIESAGERQHRSTRGQSSSRPDPERQPNQQAQTLVGRIGMHRQRYGRTRIDPAKRFMKDQGRTRVAMVNTPGQVGIGVKRLKSQSPQALASAGRRPASHPLPKGVGRGEGLLFSELES